MAKKKTLVQKKINGAKPVDGERSKYMQEFKSKTGLVSMKEIRQLPITSIEALNKKIELMERYTVANQRLVDMFGSVGGRAVNALNQVVDLQARLLQLEEQCEMKGENPLENQSWLKARDMLAKETQFIHKHGLDVLNVESQVNSRQTKRAEDTDTVFINCEVNEVEVEK